MNIFGLTARLRRQFPRNADVLELCDAAERLAASGERREPKRDRAAYMRDYRRNVRMRDGEAKTEAGPAD